MTQIFGTVPVISVTLSMGYRLQPLGVQIRISIISSIIGRRQHTLFTTIGLPRDTSIVVLCLSQGSRTRVTALEKSVKSNVLKEQK